MYALGHNKGAWGPTTKVNTQIEIAHAKMTSSKNKNGMENRVLGGGCVNRHK